MDAVFSGGARRRDTQGYEADPIDSLDLLSLGDQRHKSGTECENESDP